jgi:hypothetical protein
MMRLLPDKKDRDGKPFFSAQNSGGHPAADI